MNKLTSKHSQIEALKEKLIIKCFQSYVKSLVEKSNSFTKQIDDQHQAQTFKQARVTAPKFNNIDEEVKSMKSEIKKQIRAVKTLSELFGNLTKTDFTSA